MVAQARRLRSRVEAGARALDHLGPQRVLARGYSITTLEGSSAPLKDASRVHGGQVLVTRLARGRVRSLVSSAGLDEPGGRIQPAPQPSLFDEPPEREPSLDERSEG